MARTLAEIGSEILKRSENPEDSSTTQLLADAKAYANQRARTIWRSLMLPEYLILGAYTLPASTRQITLANIVVDSGYTTSAGTYNASFAQIAAIRQGSNPLMPEDSGAIQKLQADLWAQNTSPTLFINRGQQGVTLLGIYPTATDLSFFGKAAFQDLTDSETWIVDNHGDALVFGGTADILRYHERDDNRANLNEQFYEAEVARLVRERKVQGADMTRVIPLHPWTEDASVNSDISKIGINSNFW